ncbi:hypothetical protein BDZ97DRAFT_1653100, partial [Flammula alnicola]
DATWKVKEQSEEARYIHEKATQLEAIRRDLAEKEAAKTTSDQGTHPMDRDFEGGFGGQEDLEDRYATTSGEH